MRPTISVIIPCYNAAQYIEETLQSIYSQKFSGTLEVLLIDDGSSDDLKNRIKSFPELQYFYQINSGVSAARNYGLQLAVGDFVIFFDADDLMSEGFIEARLQPLLTSDKYGFSCGKVKPFPVKRKILFGAAENIEEEVLLYNQQIATCPSNYLIRRNILVENNILFNENLASSADRFFLLELNQFSKCILVEESPMLYRISESSMSHFVSRNLINDSNQFRKEVEKNNLAPKSIRNIFLRKIYYILGAGYIRTGRPIRGLYFLIKRFLVHPIKSLRKEN